MLQCPRQARPVLSENLHSKGKGRLKTGEQTDTSFLMVVCAMEKIQQGNTPGRLLH